MENEVWRMNNVETNVQLEARGGNNIKRHSLQAVKLSRRLQTAV